ncbi:MAG: alpha/beta hydrolase [Planctomycetes bacterium]|nr:alpha/beta hydrolase [Planctomycetota bacterium]
MSDSDRGASAPEPTATPNRDAAKPPSRLRRGVRTVALRVIFWYAVICMVLGFFQRSLMYFPTQAGRIDTAEAGLADGRLHEIDFTTADGLNLRGWHLLAGDRCCAPDQCDEELAAGRPLVLFFHGNGGDRRGRADDARLFADAGADVFLIDYRGYAENPGQPTETGLIADARAAWKYAVETRGVAPQRIIVYGESLGGGVAVPLAAEVSRAGTPPGGLVLRSTFSSMVDAAAVHYPWLPVRLLLLDRYRSDLAITSVKCPVLMLHGTQDTIVPLALGRRLFALAPPESAGVPKRFIELPGAGHNDVLYRAKRQFAEAISDFVTALAAGAETSQSSD